MLWRNIGKTRARWQRPGLAGLGLVLFLLACSGSSLPLPFIKTATPTRPALVINLEVTLIRPTETPTPLPTATPTETPVLDTPTPTVTPLISPTPTFTPIGAPAPDNPAAAPGGEAPALAPTAISPSVTITPTLGWQESGISLLEPPDGMAMPPETGPAEFKWVWGQGCEPVPDGQGFEVRVWPEVAGYGPMGAMDAAANQADVSCDVKSGVRSYRVGNLRDTPGVSAVGWGRFRWDVAIVQLQPYTVLAVSGSRVFDLPIALAAPTPEPQPLTAADTELAGTLTLVEPQDDLILPGTKKVEFKWQWSNSGGGCLQPPDGYGFELRIWPNRPDFGPMGAMGDARQSQKDVFCDTSNGLRGYLVKELTEDAPGVAVAGAGEFRWDVAFVRLDPYTIITTAEARVFTIPGVSKLDP